MSDNYNLDAIPNSIFDNIIIDNSLNLDEIFDITFMQDPDLQSLTLDSENLNNSSSSIFEVDMGSVVNAQEATASHPPTLQHDCMWSGVCQDPSHPSKSKNMKFSVKVCRDFEKELGWTSSSESGDEETIEKILETNLPSLFPSKLPQPPLPQLVSNGFSQALPGYQNQNLVGKKLIHPMNFIRSQYVLPPNTTIKAPPNFSHQFQIYKPYQPQQTIVKVEQQPAKVEQPMTNNVVKFIPKVPCFPYQLKNPVLHQHILPPKLKIEPVYIYNTEQLEVAKPVFLNYGSAKATQNDRFVNDTKKGPKKRKTDVKAPKKSNLKNQKVKQSTSFDSFNSTRDHDYQQFQIRKYGSDTDDPTMVYEKRNLHNNMERQRRIGMRNLFVELKKAIPTLDDRERVPKVNILKEAISYCGKVQYDEKLLAELKRKNNRLVVRAMKLGFSPATSVSSSTSSASSCTGGEGE